MENGKPSSMDRGELKHLIKHTQLFIGGEFVDAISGKRFETFDPSRNELIAHVAEGDAEDVDAAVRSARQAFDEGPWPRMPGEARGKIVYKFAQLLEQNAEELAKLESLNNGMPLQLSMGVLKGSVSTLQYNAGWADKISGKTVKTGGPFHAYTLSEPYGVVGLIVPWNFPIYTLLCKLSAALVCGNTVVAKPAEQTPLTALALAKLAQQAGVPPGVFNVVTGFGPTAGAAIAKHMDVDKVSFTGSTEVGRSIMESAARSNLKPVTLELGGKSPFIICEDADLDVAVEFSYHSVFTNQGQVCIAGSRVFVQDSIYDEYIKRAVARAQKRVVGDPLNMEVEHGPQISQTQVDMILGYIKSGKDEGARLVLGGNRIGGSGLYIEPTIFADVKQTMTIAKKEIFGPVLSVLKFKTLEEAIKLANNTTYGLAAAVFSKNIDTVNRVSRSVKAGVVYVNTYFQGGPGLPFGGYKMSGIGRENGPEGLSNYLQTKSVIMPIQDSPWL